MSRRWFLVALLPLAGACAVRSNWSGEIEAPGLGPPPGSPVGLTVRAADPANEGSVAELSRLLMEELRLAGYPVVGSPSPAVELDLRITHIAPGGAWGEEAECHVEVRFTMAGGGGSGSFKAIGYSGSTWVHDRIPTALAEAAKAVAGRLASRKP